MKPTAGFVKGTVREMVEQKRKVDFTQGKLFFKILWFILPIVATNLLQAFYSSADMMIVSLSADANAVGAVGTTTSFISLIVHAFIGFSVGANVVVARNIGAGDESGRKKAIHTALLIAVFFGVVGAVVGAGISRAVLMAMGNRGSLLELGVRYTYFYFLGVPFLALTNYLIAIFRAKGDSKTPLTVLLFAGLVNVGLDLFFVLALKTSVEGVAVATVIANVFSCLVLLIKLKKTGDFSFKSLKIELKALKDIIFIGFPAAIQGTLAYFSNMLIQSSIVTVNNLVCSPDSDYQAVVNGCAAGRSLSHFVHTAQNGVYQGVITFTSQNIGANKPKRVYKIMSICCLFTTSIGLSLAMLIFLFKAPLLALYGVTVGTAGSLQSIAYQAATTHLLFVCLPYFLNGLLEVGIGTLRGMGKSTLSMILSFVGVCVLRILWILVVFPLRQTLEVVYICYPITWIITAIAVFVCVFALLNQKIKLNEVKNESSNVGK